MNLQELKMIILDHTPDTSFKIFLCEDNFFLAKQYVKAISENQNLICNYVDDFSDIKQDSALSLIFDYSANLNILITDIFKEANLDFNNLENCIVICSSIDKSTLSLVKDYIINFPKLSDWQVKAYINQVTPELTEEQIDWLYTATNGNIYKIQSELDKLNLVQKDERSATLSAERLLNGSDLYYTDEFQIKDIILKKQLDKLAEFLEHIDTLNFNLYSLIVLLIKDLTKITFITGESGLTAEDIGVSIKQFNYIKYNYRYLTDIKLKNTIYFLNSIDSKLKNGELDSTNNNITSYVLCKLISLL